MMSVRMNRSVMTLLSMMVISEALELEIHACAMQKLGRRVLIVVRASLGSTERHMIHVWVERKLVIIMQVGAVYAHKVWLQPLNNAAIVMFIA